MAKNTIKIDHQHKILIMDKTFYKNSCNVRNEEYDILQKVRADYPTYLPIVRRIKKSPNKECYKGLTYEYMKRYIEAYEPEETRAEVLAKFDEMKFISQCHSTAHRYPVIKKWFLDKYPAVKNCGLPTDTITSDEENASASFDEPVMLPKSMGNIAVLQEHTIHEQAV